MFIEKGNALREQSTCTLARAKACIYASLFLLTRTCAYPHSYCTSLTRLIIMCCRRISPSISIDILNPDEIFMTYSLTGKKALCEQRTRAIACKRKSVYIRNFISSNTHLRISTFLLHLTPLRPSYNNALSPNSPSASIDPLDPDEIDREVCGCVRKQHVRIL